ncbi:hypothetical protein Tco_0313044 [Tanacetum coccineum]
MLKVIRQLKWYMIGNLQPVFIIRCLDMMLDNVKKEEHVMVEKMTKRFETTDEGKEDQNSGKHEKNGKGMHQGYRSNGNNVVKSQGTRNNNFSQWKHNGNGRSRVPNIRRHEYRKRQVDAENLNKEGNGSKPTLIESMTWSKDMIYYFKEKWEEDREKQRNKGIEVCAVLETRLKCKKLQKACDKVFQDWEWVSNMDVCNKGCRIVIGWDNETNICKWEALVYCWDMNVNLYPNEHSCGTSIMNSDMMEFQDCLNALEVEDICSSDTHFTWIKNLHKANLGIMTRILKKLDRIMSNEDFIKKIPQAHAKFLPYIISDHTHAILCIPSNEAKLMEEFCEAESDEEKFLHQQAKIKWLCDGDKNIKFFHRVLKGINIESSGTLFKKKLSSVVADKIIADISDAEIKRALFDIDDTKAPSPDGFTVAFFKQAWSIVVQILVMILKSFLL